MKRWIMVLMIAAAPLLFGCAHNRPAPEPRIVTVEGPGRPVMVTCAAEEPQTRPYPDTAEALAAAPNIFELAKLLMAARAIRPANEAILRAARKGCEGVKLAAPAPEG